MDSNEVHEHQGNLGLKEGGYDRIAPIRSRNWNICIQNPVFFTGTVISIPKFDSGLTGNRIFKTQYGSGNNRTLRINRNSGRDQNSTSKQNNVLGIYDLLFVLFVCVYLFTSYSSNMYVCTCRKINKLTKHELNTHYPQTKVNRIYSVELRTH